MSTTVTVEWGRASFDRSHWGKAYAQLSAAERDTALGPEDLERLAVAAYLVGGDEASAVAWERAHRLFLERGEVARAVRSAFWLAFGLLNRGEMARGGGWLSRAQRLLDDHRLDCAERGYLLVPAALQTLEGGDPGGAYGQFGRVAELGARFGEPDLVAMGRLGQGSALIRADRTGEGLALLDETMVAVVAGEVSATVAGTVYCAVILFCREAFDLRRAREWTAALTDWCDAHPDLVPFRGQCLVHRSQILQLGGEWPKAMDEIRQACDRLSVPAGQPALGMALQQRGELHRVRGEFAQAEEAYREAARWGHEPHPGLALLWLARGQVQDAAGAIRRVVEEARARHDRARMLPAYVEIMLAAGDSGAARHAAAELAEVATDLGTPLLQAMSAGATGMVVLGEGDPRAALEALHRGCACWRALDAPYENARARVLVGLAYRALGDEQTAELELAAARQVFRQLGAVPDRERVDALVGATPPSAAGGPTARELEVLALVAEGMTNRRIAAQLCISEQTVRRHLQNLFHKLGVSSRAAATAYALRHDLI